VIAQAEVGDPYTSHRMNNYATIRYIYLTRISPKCRPKHFQVPSAATTDWPRHICHELMRRGLQYSSTINEEKGEYIVRFVKRHRPRAMKNSLLPACIEFTYAVIVGQGLQHFGLLRRARLIPQGQRPFQQGSLPSWLRRRKRCPPLACSTVASTRLSISPALVGEAAR
jgi:hypothetical protein